MKLNEWNAHAVFPFGTLATAQRGSGINLIQYTGCIPAVVAKEDDERTLGYVLYLKVLHQVAEGLVNPLDQRCVCLVRSRLLAALIVLGEAMIRVEGRVHRVVRHVEEEWAVSRQNLGDFSLRFPCQGFSQENVSSMILVEVGHWTGEFVLLSLPKPVLP